MKQGEAPWFLTWSSALLFAFGMVWGWLVATGAAKTVTILDTPVRSSLLVGAGVLGTVLGQFGMLRAWRRYMRATEGDLQLCSTARSGKAPEGEPSCEVATKRTEVGA